MALKFLITGASGQVGQALADRLAPHGEVIALKRQRLNLADPVAIAETVRSVAPDILFNPAAWTAVDAAETDPVAAAAVNAQAPAVLADAARACGALLVHWSTDFVFNGIPPLDATGHPRGWLETDSPQPLSVYGATKLAGEQAVLASGARALILRTAWVWSRGGKCFPEAILARARSGGELRVVADQEGTPTNAISLAQAAIDAALALWHEPGREGLYHVTGSGHTNWYEFAVEACEAAGLEVDITRIATADWPTPAKRPAWSVLDCSAFEKAFGTRLPDWRDEVRRTYSTELPSAG
jgi:dTDP-4-dehydrorhamnose reductase